MAKLGQRSEVGRTWRGSAAGRTKREVAAARTRRSLAAKKGAETRKARAASHADLTRTVGIPESRVQKRDRYAKAYGMSKSRRKSLGSSPLQGQLGQMDPSSPETLLGQTLIDPARLAQLERDSRELEGRREEERVERAERMAKTRETNPHDAHHELDIFHACPGCEPRMERLRGRVERETLAGEEVAARDRRLALEQVERAKGAARVRLAKGEPLPYDDQEFWDQEKAGVDQLQEEHGLKGCLGVERAEAPAGLKPAAGQLFPLGWELRKDGFGWKGGAQGGEMPPPISTLPGIKRTNMFDKVEHEDERPEHRLLERLDLQEKALQTLLEATHLLIDKLTPLLPDGWMPTSIPEGPQLKESSTLVLQVDRVANRIWVLNNQLRELRVALQL